MKDTKEAISVGSIWAFCGLAVGRYARFICAMNLQCIAELMQQCWAISIALDMETHMAIGFCDIRIRICHKFTVNGFRLPSILVHERHTGENVFNIFARALDALYATWRTKIIGAVMDGEKMMTGRREGVVSRIQNVAKLGFTKVWSGGHQLDICMQAFYLNVRESFYWSPTTLVAFSRRQKNFMSQEWSQCFLICDTCWLNMIKVITWFDKYRLSIAAYLVEKFRLQARRSVVDWAAYCLRYCWHCCPRVQIFAGARSAVLQPARDVEVPCWEDLYKIRAVGI